MQNNSLHPLLVEDARAAIWRIDPDGHMAEIPRELYEAGPDAVSAAPADMSIEFFERAAQESRSPFDVMAFAKCHECGGRGYVECMVVSRHEADGSGGPVRRLGADETLDDLRRGESVGPNVWDCDECPKSGVTLEWTGAQLTVSELRQWVRGAGKVAA